MIRSISARPAAGGRRSNRLLAGLDARIRRGELAPGERLPPVRELARRHGVSYGVALRVVAELERAGLVERLQGSGTYVTDRSSVARSTIVQILIYPQRRAFGPALQALVCMIQDRGLTPVPIVFDPADARAQRRLIEQWKQDPPRAVIVSTRCKALAQAVDAAGVIGVRFVTLCMLPSDAQRWHNVRPDEEQVYCLAARRLIQDGHRRIGLLAHQGRRNAAHLTLKRQGIERALREAGVERGLTICHTKVSLIAAERDDAPPPDAALAPITRWLTGAGRPTAVVEHVERVGLIRMALRRAGLTLGRDLAIVGVGDPALSLHGEFPCVGENLDELARCTVDLVVSADPEIERVARHIVVPPRPYAS